MSIDLGALAAKAGGTFNGKDALIPGPGHSKRDRSLSLSIGKRGQLLVFSFAGDKEEAIHDHLRALGVDIDAVMFTAEAAKRCAAAGLDRSARNARFAADLWRAARPLAHTPGAVYLAARAIAPPWPSSLRFHGTCPDGPFERPAIIAARTMLDAGGDVRSVQRIYLRRDGRGKAEIADAKKTLGACKGGGVVLGEIEDELLIAEGVETAMSAAAMFVLPAVATLGVSHTRALILPKRVRRVVIAADNDEPGLRAAEALAVRLRREGRDVRIETPPMAFKDFNDLANGKERAVPAARSFRGG